MQVTLEDIHAKQTELAAMIARFTAVTSTLDLPEATIDLAAGELYAGAILNEDGSINRHVVLLPDAAESVDWQAAKAWAAAHGGTLPTRQEQALLYTNRKAAFEPDWYWSSEEHTNGSYAWSQYFDFGLQIDDGKSFKGRARAVRLIHITD